MTYSCSDFVNTCEELASDYKLPEITAEEFCDMSGEDPAEFNINSDEGLRVLAERIARGLSDRLAVITAARELLDYVGGSDITDAAHPVAKMRAALAEVS